MFTHSWIRLKIYRTGTLSGHFVKLNAFYAEVLEPFLSLIDYLGVVLHSLPISYFLQYYSIYTIYYRGCRFTKIKNRIEKNRIECYISSANKKQYLTTV